MNLTERIVQASKIVGGSLSADKKNKEQNYEYISSDKIMTICGRALVEAGVSVIPGITNYTSETHEYESFGKQKRRFDAVVNMVMVVSDGETTINTNWVGAGTDFSTPDKALYKAITGGHKYFLAKLLNVGAGNEDGEHETAQDDAAPAAPPAKTNGKAQEVKAEAVVVAKPVTYPQPKDAPLMALETAMNVTNSEGVKYGDLDSEKLSVMSLGIAKGLKNKDITSEHKNELELKRDAIKVILAARNEAAK